MRLREVRSCTAEYFHFLAEELVPFPELTNFSILRTRDARFLACLDAFLTRLFVEGADVDAEALRDLRERDFWAAI